MLTRRHFLEAAAAAPLGFSSAALGSPSAQVDQIPDLAGQLGLVSASLSRHFSERPSEKRFSLLDFPRVLRDELDLTVADLNTMNFPSLAPAYAEKLRTALDNAGCIATNLKMNQKVDLASEDAAERAEAMRVYKTSIDAAQILGCHWARPLPRAVSPHRGRLLEAFDELIDYAGERGVTILIENFGWMADKPDSVVDLADAIGADRVAVGPDTGNWNSNAIRYPALETTFPRAVTCDFKAKTLGPNGEHEAYDLERCFEIGWEAGFRGPWCFEHGHADRDVAFRGIAFLRDSLRTWMKEPQPKVSRQNIRHNVAVNVGQAKVPARITKGEFLVVES
ncbi:MAG: TIM barrel protein [Verrucomicrobiales bacterium]